MFQYRLLLQIQQWDVLYNFRKRIGPPSSEISQRWGNKAHAEQSRSETFNDGECYSLDDIFDPVQRTESPPIQYRSHVAASAEMSAMRQRAAHFGSSSCYGEVTFEESTSEGSTLIGKRLIFSESPRHCSSSNPMSQPFEANDLPDFSAVSSQPSSPPLRLVQHSREQRNFQRLSRLVNTMVVEEPGVSLTGGSNIEASIDKSRALRSISSNQWIDSDLLHRARLLVDESTRAADQAEAAAEAERIRNKVRLRARLMTGCGGTEREKQHEAEDMRTVKLRVEYLKEAKNVAVAAEDYERAAVLKREIEGIQRDIDEEISRRNAHEVSATPLEAPAEFDYERTVVQTSSSRVAETLLRHGVKVDTRPAKSQVWPLEVSGEVPLIVDGGGEILDSARARMRARMLNRQLPGNRPGP